MRFRPLPPGLAKEMIRGHEDILTPLVKAQEARTSGGKCPRCGSVLQSRLHPVQVFGANDLIPRKVSFCVDCGFTRDPETGIVIDVGSISRLPERRSP